MNELIPSPSINTQNDLITAHAAEGLRHYAITLIESYERYWNLNPAINDLLNFKGRTPEAIVAALNANIPLAIERNTRHNAMATHCNEYLELIGSSLRVPTAVPTGFSFDATTSQFVYTSLESIENE